MVILFLRRDSSSAVVTHTVHDVDASSEASDVSSVIASVDEYGVMTTGDELGMTTLVVTSREENDVNQTLAVAVKVWSLHNLFM